ncbi:MAG: type II secretion system GspH family protein [Oscillospiraceae bacterium]|nr:type II secretion system GspH family protein [Oscillospiraceae bacterium]
MNVELIIKRVRKIFISKRGFTLIEVIVVCVLFAIIATTAISVLSPMLKAYARANDIAEYNLLLDNVGNTIVSSMMQASDVKNITDNSVIMIVDSSLITYSVVDGILQKNDSIVFPKNFYKGKDVSFVVTPATDAPDFLITVTVSSSSTGASISRSYAVNPPLMDGQ